MTEQQKIEIRTQVRDLIEQTIASDQIADVAIVVAAVVGSWDPPGGRDADKWTISGYYSVRAIAREEVRRYEPGNEDDATAQMEMFPGYEKLHPAYVIPAGERKGKIVPTQLLTVAEAMAIVDELNRNITGLSIHKNELLRFIDEVLVPRGNGN